jgi:hypothetical protein
VNETSAVQRRAGCVWTTSRPANMTVSPSQQRVLVAAIFHGETKLTAANTDTGETCAGRHMPENKRPRFLAA